MVRTITLRAGYNVSWRGQVKVGYLSPHPLVTFEHSHRRLPSRQRLRQIALKQAGESFLYAMVSGNALRFGLALNPRKRQSEIQADCPNQVKLIGAIRCDKALGEKVHAVLTPEKINGEWFKPSNYAITIAACIEKQDIKTLIHVIESGYGRSLNAGIELVESDTS